MGIVPDLELDGLCRRYGTVTALDGLSFGVPAGQVFGFLGPNGAGKTTTMRAIFGLTSLDAGEIRWHGRPVTEPARRGFGYMPEERGLYPGMRLCEQVEYFGLLHDMPEPAARKAATDWLGRLGLADRLDARVDALSHGNQQRAQLAAALVHEPELLVLDEPFAGLDPGGVDDMSAILAERAAAGVTVLFSSHQLDLVENLCEAVAIIHRGRVVASGDVADLQRGGRPRLAVQVAGDPDGAWARAAIGPELGEITGSRKGKVFISLTDRGDSQRILDLARAAGAVEHFSFEARRLSDVFREVTGASVGQAEAVPAADRSAAGMTGASGAER
jgi:ABC-2 type transport system ATP-binding protein